MHVETDIRPIAVTNAISKVDEKFISRYFNEFFGNHTDVNQFGRVHGRSTTHALLKVVHELFVTSDCLVNIIRILFVFDFCEALEPVNHNISLNNLSEAEYQRMSLCGRLTF